MTERPAASRRSVRRVLAALCLAGLACAAAPAAAAPPAPRLLLFVVIDQCRADYLERFRPLLRHGLDRLLRESALFTRARHAHAIAKTAPGHATLASGTHPRRHGIIANEWIDPETDREISAVDDPQDGVSPRLLLATTLGEWLRARDPRSRVYAVSVKDRSAALLAGHGADGAFWYDEKRGRFVSSEYYPRGGFDDLGSPALWSADRHFGRLWEPLSPTAWESTAGVHPLDRGALARAFPHSAGDAVLAPDEDFYEDLEQLVPFLDETVEELAEALVVARGLGQDDATDLLAVSFSTLDRIGHRYGMNSPELLDALLRIDLSLGRLLDFLDRRVGRERVAVSLSSDHGATPVPGERRARGFAARKLYGEDVACFQRLGRALARRGGASRLVRPGPRFDPDTLAALGLDRAALEVEARRELEACPGVARVWTRGELAGDLPPAEPYGELFANAFHRQRSPDLLVQLAPGFIAWTRQETTHSSAYDDDLHVPWLVRWPGAPPRRIDDAVATVDVAPTLAELLGLVPPDPIDGVSRAAWLLAPTADSEKESR